MRISEHNRWGVVLGALLIQLCLGAIYAWSVFTPALTAAGWSRGETQMVFAAGLASFAVVMVLAGRLMPVFGPRLLTWAGGAVLGGGYFLGGAVAPLSFWPVLLFVGVVGGSGIGLAYVVPIAVGVRWFPDQKGMITGLAVAGFGFGAMLWVKLAGTWGGLLASIGLGRTFMLYGLIFFIAVLIGGIWMRFPSAGPAAQGAEEPSATGDLDSGRMLRTPQFYLIFATFMCGSSAGLMCIGLMKLFPLEALGANGIAPAEASAIAGTAMAVFFSVAHGLGRILWGTISDYIGRRLALVLMTAMQGCAVILFQWMACTPGLLYLGAAVIGFNFGGNFSLFPTITADCFGTKFLAQNYGWVFLSYGFGGILGPIIGGRLGDQGNFPLAFTLCGVLCLAAAVVAAFIRPYNRKPCRQ
ncbi:MAG: OFA family MFS transporter [Elusimicrobiota bacterium]